MRVFLTGASGYIGSAVGRALAAAGHEVHGLVRTAEKARMVAGFEVQPVVGTLEDVDSWAPVARGCSVLIHAAVEYSARTFELDRLAVNTLLGLGEGQASRTFLYTSGVWIYGSTGCRAVDESTPVAPPEMVRPRADVEHLVLAGNTSRMRTLVLRPGCVYGASGSLTAMWFASAAKERATRIIGDGSNRWAMVHVSDLADLYVRAAESDLRGDVINATDRSRFTVLECARAASFAAGAEGKVEQVPVAAAREQMGPMADCLALDQHVDSRKAVQLLGWQPRHGGFVDGVDRYYQAWKALQG